MACITSCAEIHIPRYPLMLLIYLLLIAMFMAENTLKDLVVIWIHVAIGAYIPLALMPAGINREILAIMIPGRLVPNNGVMTGFTIRRESGRLMIGIGSVIIILLVTGITVRWRTGVSVGMTSQTGQHRVRAG